MRWILQLSDNGSADEILQGYSQFYMMADF